MTPLPGASPQDLCLTVEPNLWHDVSRLSLWVEALCIHEWCLFTECVDSTGGCRVTRGEVYTLLTDRPANRRPLTWERNQIDILILEGQHFCCPWTGRRITEPSGYDLDHVIPVSVYPMNELWNLVPADPDFNQHAKRERLPSGKRLARALPALESTYTAYTTSEGLCAALRDDASRRFAHLPCRTSDLPSAIVTATARFVEVVAGARNLARF